MMFNLSGVSVAAVTPFDAGGNFEEKSFCTLLDWWLKQGVHGIVACGTTGEFAYLNHSERRRVFEVAVQHINGRVPVIVGTGFASTKETIAMNETASAVGADAALVITPYYYPVAQKALYEHYKRVAEYSKIPVLLYNNPQVAHVTLEAETVAELAKVDNIAGIKDSAGDWALLEKTLQLVDEKFIVYSGSFKLLPDALKKGADGGILAIANIVPSQCVQLYELCKRGKFEEAKVIHEEIKTLIRSIVEPFGISGLKTALKLMGLPAGYPQRPLLPMSAGKEEEIQKVLKEFNLLAIKT
jgi:4-hydroxy-tetrahydrodipicolinate synthase